MTLIDADTGEIVQSVALAIPRPDQVVDVYRVCDQVECDIELISDVADAKEAQRKLKSIEEYFKSKSKDGLARLEGALRRLEVRIGELAGMAVHGRNQHSDSEEFLASHSSELTKKELHEFRLMAQHADVVESVIAVSTDIAPASRRKVIDAIRRHQDEQQKEDTMARLAATEDRDEQIRILVALGQSAQQIADELDLSTSIVYVEARRLGLAIGKTSKAAVRRRAETIADLAAKGHSVPQIAEIVGVTTSNVRAICQRRGIEIPADAALGRAQRINVERVIDESLNSLDGLVMGLSMIWDDIATQDAEKRLEWLEALGQSLAALNRFKKELSK